MPGDWTITLADEAEEDFSLLAEHLAESYHAFGLALPDARRQALRRVRALRGHLTRLKSAPHRGTRHDDLLPDLRNVTFDALAVWFRVDEDAGTVRVLALFYSGQDQHARMLARISLPQR